MKCDPYPDISDDLKAHALALTIGRHRTTPALLAVLTLENFLWICCWAIDQQVEGLLKRYNQVLPDPAQVTDGPILAPQLIARWKGDASIREKFGSFRGYVMAVENMLTGERHFDPTLLP